MSNNGLLFLKQLWQHPQQVSALTPSSPTLARSIAREVSQHNSGNVIELGAGTGNVTHALLAAGIKPEHLHLVEINQSFVDILKRDLSACHIHHCSAETITELPVQDVDVIVSGLPLLACTDDFQYNLLRSVFRVLKPGGVFIQFTYSFTPNVRPTIVKQLNLQWKKSARVYRSLPPASIFVFSQRA